MEVGGATLPAAQGAGGGGAGRLPGGPSLRHPPRGLAQQAGAVAHAFALSMWWPGGRHSPQPRCPALVRVACHQRPHLPAPRDRALHLLVWRLPLRPNVEAHDLRRSTLWGCWTSSCSTGGQRPGAGRCGAHLGQGGQQLDGTGPQAGRAGSRRCPSSIGATTSEPTVSTARAPPRATSTSEPPPPPPSPPWAIENTRRSNGSSPITPSPLR